MRQTGRGGRSHRRPLLAALGAAAFLVAAGGASAATLRGSETNARDGRDQEVVSWSGASSGSEKGILRNLQQQVAAATSEECYGAIQGSVCTSAQDALWSSEARKVLLNGEQVLIKGVTWSGIHTVQGRLTVAPGTVMDDYFPVLADLGINAIRLPVCLDMAVNPAQHAERWKETYAAFSGAARHGIVILLDMHNLNCAKEYGNFYDDVNYTKEDFISGWIYFLEKLLPYPSLFAIDVYNEAHNSSWNATRNMVAELLQSINAHFDMDPKMPNFAGKLVFVQGGEGVDTCGNGFFWGANYLPSKNAPLTNKIDMYPGSLVNGAHTYGPGVYDHGYFSAKEGFPDNLTGIFDCQFSILTEDWQSATVWGEWGGRTDFDRDLIWMEHFVDYMGSHCMMDNFLWALTPDSPDTGGLILDGYVGLDATKVQLMHRLQPNPTKFTRIPQPGAVGLDSCYCVEHRPVPPSCAQGIPVAPAELQPVPALRDVVIIHMEEYDYPCDKGRLCAKDLTPDNSLSATYRVGSPVDADPDIGIGYIQTGEYTEYTRTFSKGGWYEVRGVVAGIPRDAVFFKVEIDVPALQSPQYLRVLSSGSWSKLSTQVVGAIKVSEGEHTLRITAEGEGLNVKELYFVSVSAAAANANIKSKEEPTPPPTAADQGSIESSKTTKSPSPTPVPAPSPTSGDDGPTQGPPTFFYESPPVPTLPPTPSDATSTNLRGLEPYASVSGTGSAVHSGARTLVSAFAAAAAAAAGAYL